MKKLHPDKHPHANRLEHLERMERMRLTQLTQELEELFVICVIDIILIISTIRKGVFFYHAIKEGWQSDEISFIEA